MLYYAKLKQFEKDLFKRVLFIAEGNQTIAAKILGINRGTFRVKCEAHDIKQTIIKGRRETSEITITRDSPIITEHTYCISNNFIVNYRGEDWEI